MSTSALIPESKLPALGTTIFTQMRVFDSGVITPQQVEAGIFQRALG